MSIVKSSKTTNMVILIISVTLSLIHYAFLPNEVIGEFGLLPIFIAFVLTIAGLIVLCHMVRILAKTLYFICGGKL